MPASAGPGEAPSAAAEPAGASNEEPVPEGKFRIALVRTARVGDTVRLRHVTRDLRDTRVTKAGRLVDRKSYARRVTLEAIVETLAVAADGRATKRRYRVQRLEADTQKAPRVIVPKGTEIVITQAPGKQGVLSASGLNLSKEDQQALDAVLPTSMSETTEQQVFGSREPRAIGESWAVDVERARAMLDETGIRPRRPPRGSTRVLEQRDVGGEPCLMVLARMELDGFALAEMEPDARIEQSSLRMRATTALPLDLARPPREQSVSIETQITLLTEKGADKLRIEIDSKREYETAIEPL